MCDRGWGDEFFHFDTKYLYTLLLENDGNFWIEMEILINFSEFRWQPLPADVHFEHANISLIEFQRAKYKWAQASILCDNKICQP